MQYRPYQQKLVANSESPGRGKPRMTIDHIARNKAQVSLASKGNKYLHHDFKIYNKKNEVVFDKRNVYDSHKYYKPMEYP